MSKYANRQEAGIILAHELKNYANHPNLIVLGLPRGGVPIAAEIGKVLQVPLDIFIVRKLGVPGFEELAMGAIAMGGVVLFNKNIIKQFNVTQEDINKVMANESAELSRRILTYRGSRPYPSLEGKTIILVDDGIATGATIRVAIRALRQLKPLKIVVAVPVAEKSVCQELRLEVDQLLCPLQPLSLVAVGAWYEEFDQTDDSTVQALLNSAE